MIRFKDTDDSISSSKENINSPLWELFIEIHKIYTPNQPLIRSKRLSDSVNDTFQRFLKINELNDVVGCF